MTQNSDNTAGGLLSAIAITGGVVLLLDILGPWLNGAYTLPLLLAPLAASYFGFLPGLLATLLSALAVAFVYFDPIGSMSIDGTLNRSRLLIFVPIGIIVSVLGEFRLRELRHFEMREAALLQKALDQELLEKAQREMTLRKLQKSRQKLRLLADQLSEADRRKDEFLATLAHELRNPLAPIQNGMEILRRTSGLSPATRDVHEMIARQTGQLIRLVDDLLDVSRITQGRLKLQTSEVILQDIIQLALETSHPVIESARHVLDIKLPEEPIYLEADTCRLAQVISNLLNNASKYTPAGGRIAVSVHCHGKTAEIIVADNGMGIPEDQREVIFDMFTQISQPLEQRYMGLGIGLTLSKSLIEMHKGSIQVRSIGVGHGSEFIVQLPIIRIGHTMSPSTGFDHHLPNPAGIGKPPMPANPSRPS